MQPDRILNKALWRKTGEEQIRRRTWNIWFGHILRRDDCVAKQMLHSGTAKPQRKNRDPVADLGLSWRGREFVFLPKKSDDLFFSRNTLHAHNVPRFKLNSYKPVYYPNLPFSCHPRFTSPNSAPSLQELLQKISLSPRGSRSEPNEPLPWIRLWDLEQWNADRDRGGSVALLHCSAGNDKA